MVLRPIGIVNTEALQKIRIELQGLIDFYFPSERRQQQASASAAVPLELRARLHVDAELGAGIDLTPSTQGFQVGHIDAVPGQDFCVGDVIVGIAGRSLAGLSEEDLEDAFGECFGDGAELVLLRAG